MTKNEAIQAAHHWQQRAEAAEKFAAGLELNLVAVIQRAEAAEAKLAKLAKSAEDTAAKLLRRSRELGWVGEYVKTPR